MTHRLWLPEEDEIVDRHARALAAGEYGSIWEAVVACVKDLQRFHEVTGRAWVRDPGTTYKRLRTRMAVLGLPWVGVGLTADEERVVQEYVSAVERGEYRGAVEASEPCRRDLARLAIVQRPWKPATVGALRALLVKRLHAAGIRWSGADWTADEVAVARRYARALTAGRIGDARTAAVKCRSALARLAVKTNGRPAAQLDPKLQCRRSLLSMAGRIRAEARKIGWPSFVRPWRPDETVIRDRYVAALVEGRFRTAKLAAAACTKELARLHRRRLRSPAYVGTLPRSYGAVLKELNHRALDLGLPRYGDKWRLQERRLLEQYARGVPSGKYGSWLEAARACHGEMAGLHKQILSNSTIPVRKLPERKLIEVHKHIIIVANKLGLEGPRRILWTDAENKICDSWVRWYEEHKRMRRYKPGEQAVLGVQEELERMGIDRTQDACREHFFKRRKRLEEDRLRGVRGRSK